MTSQGSTPDANAGPRFPVATLLGIVFSAGFLWWFVRDIEAAEIGRSFGAISWPFVLLSALVLLSEFVLRALRWRLLLDPIRPTRFAPLFEATVIGAAGNTLLPMRAGDIARAVVASGATGIRLTTIVATNIMERVYDLFGLVAILFLTFALLPDNLASTPEDLERIEKLSFYGKIIGLAALSGMVVFFGIAKHPARARGFVAFFCRPLPRPLQTKIKDLTGAFVTGLAATQSARNVWSAIGLSLLLWGNLSLAIFLLFKAFHLQLPFAAACFITVAIALAVVIPQAPGYLGVFQSVIEVTLSLWTGAELFAHSGATVIAQDIKAFAIVFWAVSFVPVTLLGLMRLKAAGMSLQQVWSQARS